MRLGAPGRGGGGGGGETASRRAAAPGRSGLRAAAMVVARTALHRLHSLDAKAGVSAGPAKVRAPRLPATVNHVNVQPTNPRPAPGLKKKEGAT